MAWVQSVQEAALAAGSLTKEQLDCDLTKDLGNDKLTAYTVAAADNLNSEKLCDIEDADAAKRYVKDWTSVCEKTEETSSVEGLTQMETGSQSVYELQVDERLETGSAAAVASSDDDASVWDSAVSKLCPGSSVIQDRIREGKADGEEDANYFDEVLQENPMSIILDESPELFTNKKFTADALLPAKGPGNVSCLPVYNVPRSEEQLSSQTLPLPEVPIHCSRSASSPRQMTSTPKKSSSSASRSLSSEAAKVRVSEQCINLTGSSVSHATIDRCHEPMITVHQSSSRDASSIAVMTKEVKDHSSTSKLQKRDVAGKSSQSKTAGSIASSTVKSSYDKPAVLSSSTTDRRSRLPMARAVGLAHRSNGAASPDSGVISDHRVVSPEHRLLSPYHAVTRPRRAVACSASSDNSSLLSDPVAMSKMSEVEVSSGYESMIRDDVEDVTSVPSSSPDTPGGGWSTSRVKMFRKKAATAKYSHVSPSRPLTRLMEGTTLCSADVESSPKIIGVWVENERGIAVASQSAEYDNHDWGEDELSIDQRQMQEAHAQSVLRRIQRVDELLERQQVLQEELCRAKNLLSVNPCKFSLNSSPGSECDGDRADPNFLHSLEIETAKLERRLQACQSRIMLVTCFDAAV
jgi:hypothetical protein